MGALLILLNILKIIGIILLIILIVIVTLLCIVVFVPFVYDIKGKKYKDMSGEGWIKWLFGIICIKFVYANGEPSVTVDIFGRSLQDLIKKRANKKRAKKKKKNIVKNKKVLEHKKEEKGKVRVVATEKKLKEQIEIETPSILKEVPLQPIFNAKPDIVAMGRLSEEKAIVKRVKIKKIEEELKIKSPESMNMEENQSEECKKEESIDKEDESGKCGKKEKIDIEYFKKMQNSEKKQVLKACTTLIKRLFIGIFPQSVHVDATIGVGDPALTGYILAMAAIAKGAINSNINIRGKFDQEIFEGELRFAGRIMVFTFISASVKFIFTKSIYKILRIYMKGRGE